MTIVTYEVPYWATMMLSWSITSFYCVKDLAINWNHHDVVTTYFCLYNFPSLCISSTAMDSASFKAVTCTDPMPDSSCNPCLDAVKACNLNAVCKRQRSAYVAACSRPSPLMPSPEPCGRKRCHRALRQFFERVQTDLSYPLLFCWCQDKACAERRRQTIIPTCSFEEKLKPNCLELRRTCRSDPLCRYGHMVTWQLQLVLFCVLEVLEFDLLFVCWFWSICVWCIYWHAICLEFFCWSLMCWCLICLRSWCLIYFVFKVLFDF